MSDASPARADRPSPEPRDTAGMALALGVVLVVALFLGSMLVATEGHFVPQVLDLYVVAQYARAMAEGHPFQYNPGEPPSTGSTSLLYTAVLAAAHAVGARGEALIAFAILAGVAAFAASVSLARRVASQLAGPREAAVAGGLVALGGPAVWGFLYGSDVAVFMALALWVLDRLLAEWSTGRLRWLPVAGVLLALARPEGIVFAVALAMGWTFGPGRRARGSLLSAWLPAAAAALGVALNRALVGTWVSSSVADKSLLANYGLRDTLAVVAEYAVDVIRGLLLGFYPSQTPVGFARGWAPFYFTPLALVFVMAAVASARPPLRAPLRLWVLAAVAIALLVSPNMFLGVHFNRYLMWAFPAVQALTAVGFGVAAASLARGDRALEARLFRGAAGLALVLGALSTLRFAGLYGEMAGEIHRRDVPTAHWIAQNLPHGVSMANAATSVEFLTGHRNLNLHGVTSAAFFGSRTAEREAGMTEALARLPEGERPPYLISSVYAQENSIVLPLLVQEPPLFRSNSLSDELVVYRTRYDVLDGSIGPRRPESRAVTSGLELVDRLNVCDSRDEAAHGYSFHSRLGELRLFGAPRVARYGVEGALETPLLDAGRAILGREDFEVRTRAGRELVIVLRSAADVTAAVLRVSGSGLHAIEIPEAGIVVAAEGSVVARATFRPRPGWEEFVLRVPAPFIRDPTTRLSLSGRYASFRYWFYQ